MAKGRFRLIAAGLVAFSLVLSSCFTIRVIGISPKVLGPGDTVKINLKLYPSSSASNSTWRVVLLVGMVNLDPASASMFDKKGNFGGPFARVTDNAARDVLLTGTQCTVYGVSASDLVGSFPEWRAYRTIDVVDSAAAAITKAFKVTINADRAAGTTNDSFGGYVVFSAAWNDDGDGTPEAGEFFCTGMMGGSVAFGP